MVFLLLFVYAVTVLFLNNSEEHNMDTRSRGIAGPDIEPAGNDYRLHNSICPVFIYTLLPVLNRYDSVLANIANIGRVVV